MKRWSLPFASAVIAFVVMACGDHHATAPTPPGPVTYAGYPGFDIGVYPGDATLTAWRSPASPYRWVGYYLAAPCHRDTTWMGQYAKVTALGWGTAVLYVGQQDWSAIPDLIPLFDRDVADVPAVAATATAVTCSASLLTTSQGSAEAADAVTKAAGEGVPAGSTIFLDVEYVTAVSPSLTNYISAWIAGVLADGRFRPGVYCAKSNVDALHAAASAAYSAAGRHDTAPFWIASSASFSITAAPAQVGVPYATVWQGLFDVTQSWSNVSATIDVDVASSPSPSAP